MDCIFLFETDLIYTYHVYIVLYVLIFLPHCTDPVVLCQRYTGRCGRPQHRRNICDVLAASSPKRCLAVFQDVERILGMNTGEIQAMWSNIRPKENGWTRHETSLT